VTGRAPAAGVPFTVHATGAKTNEKVTLTMTPDLASIGTRSLTQIANARGMVNFAVTLTEDGTYVFVSTSASGAVLGRQTVTVSDHGAVIVTGTSATAGKAVIAATGTAARGQLSFTGFGGTSLAVGAFLLLGGTGLVLVSRRRRLRQP
jgi:hypothetical protein